jgi:starch-binding outer membrane protein, SusD/RagB family
MKSIHKPLKSICIVTLIASIAWTACDEFVEVDPPRTELIKTTVFGSDATADAAALDIYYHLQRYGFASGDYTSLSFFCSISADEQINTFVGNPVSTQQFQQFADNNLQPDNSNVRNLWSEPYQVIYRTNAMIEGLTLSDKISETLKNQLLGEAKFIRAFCHFYLLNLFGDVPLITSTNYRTNAEAPRTPTAQVYLQIVDDLIDAKNLLPTDYAYTNNERVRPNKWAATTLLARTYLYMQEWAKAEIEATDVINQTDLYALNEPLETSFLKTSKEALWQLWGDYFPQDIFTFYIFATPSYGMLHPEILEAFEEQDLRRSAWIGLAPPDYYFAKKYQSFTPATEYSTVLRLAELFLIRAEARTQLDNTIGAQTDINTIRHRAGLDNTPATTKPDLLAAIENERRCELFTEWGHRWFDLKRTGRINDVMATTKPEWKPTAALFPIPEYQLLNAPGMANAQNPGY